MATINFTVGVPAGAPIGNVDGENGYISSYLAQNVSGYKLSNDIIFCIAPDLNAASGPATYTVLNGITGTGLSTKQTTALEGLFSHYFDGGNTSFTTQEEVMIADWTIVNPNLKVTGVSSTITNAADKLVMDALNGKLSIDPNLDFITLVSQNHGQSFVNFYDPTPTPIPPALGLFLSALLLMTAFVARKKLSLRRIFR